MHRKLLLNITNYNKNFSNKYLSKLLLQIRKLIETNRKFSFLLSFSFLLRKLILYLYLLSIFHISYLYGYVNYTLTLSWQVRWDSFFCDKSNDQNLHASYVSNIPVHHYLQLFVFLELFIKIFPLILFYNYYKCNQNISYNGFLVFLCNPSTRINV